MAFALDLSTVTGYAYAAPDDVPRAGSIRFARAGSSRPVVYRAMREWLQSWIDLEGDKLGMVVFESAASPMIMQGKTNIDTIKMLVGLCEHVEELCHGQVELREATVQQIRAHFIGSNRHKRDEAKRLTIEECRRRKWVVNDDNAADACALWAYQVSHLRPDIAARSGPLFR